MPQASNLHCRVQSADMLMILPIRTESPLRRQPYVNFGLIAANMVLYLLLNEKLPTAPELADFTERMRKSRGLKPEVRDMIRNFPAAGSPMELLQSVISYLSGTVIHQIEHSANCNCRRTLHQIAQLTTVLATYQRFKEGKDYEVLLTADAGIQVVPAKCRVDGGRFKIILDYGGF